MSYQVQFVGLAWFHEEPAGTMRVLLPDGRDVPPIPPHLFSISVPRENVVKDSGWDRAKNEVESDTFQTEYWPPPSKIVIGQSGQPGSTVLDASNQIPRLPSLRAIDPNVSIDPDQGKRIGDFEFRQGRFTVSRMPGRDVKDAVLVSTLTIDEPARKAATNLVITITPLDAASGGPVRTIELTPDTEIALVNTSRGVAKSITADDGSDDHIMIYSQLCSASVTLIAPRIDAAGIEELRSQHPFFHAANPSVVGPGCSNMKT